MKLTGANFPSLADFGIWQNALHPSTLSLEKFSLCPFHISHGAQSRLVTGDMLRGMLTACSTSAYMYPGSDEVDMTILVLSCTVRFHLSATPLLSGERGGVVCSCTPSSAIDDSKAFEVNSPPLSVRSFSILV